MGTVIHSQLWELLNTLQLPRAGMESSPSQTLEALGLRASVQRASTDHPRAMDPGDQDSHASHQEAKEVSTEAFLQLNKSSWYVPQNIVFNKLAFSNSWPALCY